MSLGNFDLLVSCPGSLDPKDPARKYGRPDPNNRNNFTCNFCGKVTKGGAYRLKQHLVGGFRNVTKCYSCPEHVKEEVKFFMIKKQQAKVGGQMLPRVTQSDVDGCNDDEEDCETLNSKGGSSVKATSKRPRLKGPMDMYFTPIPEDAISGRKNGNEGRQRGSFSIYVPSRSVQSGADPIASDTPGRRDLQLQGTPSHFRRNAVYVRRRRRF
ncbi:hypothetical protein SOVF_062340 [Spinacia oleracea]|nr:hypothetical protein SOVF_062340 [Spinacia oleracea]